MKLETETEVRFKNTPVISTYAIGATKDNEMKIFDTITLISTLYLVCLICTKTEVENDNSLFYRGLCDGLFLGQEQELRRSPGNLP